MHVALLVDLVIGRQDNHKFLIKRRFTEEATLQFNSVSTSTDWKDVISSWDNNDPEEAYENFICMYTRLYDKYFPVKRIHCCSKIYSKKPWITKALIKLCNNKSLLYEKIHL